MKGNNNVANKRKENKHKHDEAICIVIPLTPNRKLDI